MIHVSLRALDYTYFPVNRFAANEVRVTPTGRVTCGAWKAKRVAVSRAARTMEGPAYGILHVGPVYLGDLLALAFFDIEDKYTVSWRSSRFYDLSSIVVTDAKGKFARLNAAGRKALNQAETLERESEGGAPRARIRTATRIEVEATQAARKKTEKFRLQQIEERRLREAAEAEHRRRLEINRRDSLLAAYGSPPADAQDIEDELGFLSSKQRHDLTVIRRDYPELKEFDTLRIAHMLVRLNSRNSTVATLFQRRRERLQMEWSMKYWGDSGSSRPSYVRDTRLQRVFDIVRRDQLYLEALQYGVASDPETDQIAEREMRLYGISTTTFIPVEEEEENEYNDSETV